MRYTNNHKANSRKTILASALKLFSQKGFDKTSIDEIMAAAGLTRGTFYSHFKSKQELYSEAILSSKFNDEHQEFDPANGKSQVKQAISDYLDADYSDPDVLPCPLAYLVTDVANRELDVRTAYAQGYDALNSKIENLMSASGSPLDKETILSLTSMMIGSVAIARTIPDPSKSVTILSSCKNYVLKIIDEA